MGALIRATDWSATPIGPMESWSPSLRMMVRFLLANRFPLLLWWGPDYISIYNDPYRPVLGAKHPWALGKPVRECWNEIWHVLQPLIDTPFKGGPATWNDDIELEINRHGFLEETHFTIAYSPVPDDTVPGGVGGVLATVHEITEKVVAERRVVALRDLGAGVGEAATAEQACALAAEALARHAKDVPFALFYLLDSGGRQARLAGAAGFASPDAPGPHIVDLTDPAADRWRLAEALRTKAVQLELGERGAEPPLGPWSDPPSRALVLEIPSNKPHKPAGLLVAGISARLKLDDYYRDFLALVATQVASAIARARAYEEERQRAEALAAIDRAKTAFFSNVSHEFRTPLTLMLGPLEDSLARPAGAPTRDDLRVMYRNTLRLLKLVNSLLDFARSEAGRAQASYEPVDLAALTRDLASAFRSAVEKGGVRFEVDCPALPEAVYVDRSMWEKIVLNLLSNAFKFTLQGVIRIALRRSEKGAELVVTDTGVGVPENELPRLFERFHRVEGSRGRTHEGTGIGLALVHDLVALHGGAVEVTSRLGEGTSFKVTLPLGKQHLPAERIHAPVSQASTAAGAQPFVEEALRWLPDLPPPPASIDEALVPGAGPAAAGPERILIADDNADMRDYLARLLGPQYTVSTAADGAQALRQALESPPDLVLTDAMMPMLDGFALLRALRADPRTAGIPVIVLSARAGEEARVGGLAAGADDYLVKPFAAKELIARVRVHVENKRLRQAAERERNRLRSLLSQLPAIVNFLRGPELVFDFAHPKAIEALGGRDVVGKPLLEAVPEYHDQEFPALLRRVVETGERIDGREKLVYIADGSGRRQTSYWDFIYLPVRGENDRVEGVMTFDRDVTDVVRARQAAEEHAQRLAETNLQLAAANSAAEAARAEADAASRAKDEFLAMLGHELRNPLAPILTALHLLRLKGQASREQEIIERQVGHVVRLVDDLLDVSRITQGKIVLRKQRLQAEALVARSVEMVAPLLEQRRQTVATDVEPGLVLTGDEDRLAQVLSNLVTNAAKYSEPESVITLAAAREGKTVRFRVRDQGSGIAPEMLPRIFDVFWQHQQSLDRSKGGLGLGLAIVQSLVALHGGKVEATSDGIGKGSEFVVELPLGEDEELVAAEAAPQPRDARAEALAIAERILVVDDNIDAADSLGYTLRKLGYSVEIAYDGPTALALARSFKPSACLLDIGLPVMDGYELAGRLRASTDLAVGARIIALTGYGREADRARSADAGFSAHLVKPVTVDALTNALRSN
jgi:signal transduction histidine kinase/DNA-binding response OmpR family regulator